MRMIHFAFLIVLAAGVTCADPFGPGETELEATADGQVLALSAQGDHAVYYAVFERVGVETVLFLWAPCADPADANCARVRPGQTVRIPYGDIPFYEEGDREAVVYWWFPRRSGDGTWRPDEVRSLVIGL